MKGTTLPLGIDVGTLRTRIALAERSMDGTIRLIAVAARPTGQRPAVAVADALAELGTRERRCVFALAAPVTQLRAVAFPSLSPRERLRAAHFEAARSSGNAVGDAVVRIIDVADTRSVLAIAPKGALDERLAIARAARLRVRAIDDEAFALLRCAPQETAVLDVGSSASRLVCADEPVPFVQTIPIGGRTFTDAIARALGLNSSTAEQRKIDIGGAGAGEAARDAFTAHVATAITLARTHARTHIRQLVLTGNGSRLMGLCETLEALLAMPVHGLHVPDHASQAIPPDVLRAAGCDWALAYGLALWETAA